MTAADIEAAWQSLTSGGTWIPDDFKFWIDPNIAGMNGGVGIRRDEGGGDTPLCEHIENSNQKVCLNGSWTSAIDAGHAPIITQVCGIEDEITNGLMAILDSVEQSGEYTTLGGDCDVPNYTVEYPFARSGHTRWLDVVAYRLTGYSCEEFYVEPDCPEREPVYLSTTFGSIHAPLTPQHNPADFFDCPPWMPAPCWVMGDHPTLGIGSPPGNPGVAIGLKKGGPYSCFWGHPDGWSGHRSGQCRNAEYRLGRIELDWDRLRQHPLNFPDGFGFFVGAPFSYISRCTCCLQCDLPLSDASFTINSSSDCWAINPVNGEKIEDKKSLGGTFTLHPIDGQCEWANEFPNSFIDNAVLERYSVLRAGDSIYGLRLTLFHRGTTVETYEVNDSDVTNDPVKNWQCSGPITLAKQWNGFMRGMHVCDPCSWDHENHAFAIFNLNRGLGGFGARVIDPDRVATFNNATIKLTSTDGTERTYTLKTDGSADPNLLEFNWDLTLGPAGTDGGNNPNTFRNFKTVVESSAGHDGKIIVDISGDFLTTLPYGVMKLIQSDKGPAGETDIVYSREFRDWCREDREYPANIGGVPPCPDKFEGGDWCMYLNPYTNIMEPKCRKFTTHPNSWPHDCPCTMNWIVAQASTIQGTSTVRRGGFSNSCLPETITVTI